MSVCRSVQSEAFSEGLFSTTLKKMNKHLAKQIREMARLDQKARFDVLASKTKPGTPNPLVYVVDACHNYRIWKLIADHGFPAKKTIGAKALISFWLLVQHQDMDLKLQKECLQRCGFALRERAHLFDRILVNEGKKQVYGTQFDEPIADRRYVDVRRKQAGLEPLAFYLKSRQDFLERNMK